MGQAGDLGGRERCGDKYRGEYPAFCEDPAFSERSDHIHPAVVTVKPAGKYMTFSVSIQP
jgi:hypothetical protein